MTASVEAKGETMKARMARMIAALGTMLVYGLIAAGESAAQTAREVLSIGKLDGASSEIFESIVDVRAADDGSITIVDEGDGSIRVFDAAGGFLRRFGGEGEGPSEFRTIGAVASTGDTLIALDRSGGKLVRFSLDGELLDTRRTSFSVSLHGFPVRMYTVPGGYLVLETTSGCSIPRREGTDTLWRLLLIPPDRADPRELDVAERGNTLAVYGSPQPTFCATLPLPFAPGPVAAVREDGTLAFGTGRAAHVDIYDPGIRDGAGAPDGARPEAYAGWLSAAPSHTLRLPGARRSLTRAERSAWRDSVLAVRAGEEAPRDVARRFREVVNEVVPPESWPAYDRLVYDRTGDLWARRPAPPGASVAEWDVVDGSGSHRGTVSLPAGLDVHAIVDGDVYGVIRGDLDVQRVKKYAVTWN